MFGTVNDAEYINQVVLQRLVFVQAVSWARNPQDPCEYVVKVELQSLQQGYPGSAPVTSRCVGCEIIRVFLGGFF